MAKTPRRNRRRPLVDLIRDMREYPDSRTLAGKLTTDRNFPGRRLIVDTSSTIYSIREEDIIDEGTTAGGLAVVNVLVSAQLWQLSPTVLGPTASESTSVFAMEHLEPPLTPPPRKGDPKPGSAADAADIKVPSARMKSIRGAASKYSDSCAGGDKYENNCAHYLADAFIRAGYNELTRYSTCITYTDCVAKRPIRAREMWCWFRSMAAESRRTLPENEGFWAVFQLDETVYWGGHVMILDTDTNKYYGRGHYPHWDQYAYRW